MSSVMALSNARAPISTAVHSVDECMTCDGNRNTMWGQSSQSSTKAELQYLSTYLVVRHQVFNDVLRHPPRFSAETSHVSMCKC